MFIPTCSVRRTRHAAGGYHKGWTKNALNAAAISAQQKEEISIGCTANDLCELTNETQCFIEPREIKAPLAAAMTRSAAFESKDAIYSSFGNRTGLFSPMALYQSHFGCLTSLHATAKQAQEPPESTRKEVVTWFTFLNSLALGTITVDPEARIYKDKNNAAVRNLFVRCQKIEYSQLFDSKDQAEIRSRAVGMMCHLIQDLFTYSHCERNSKQEIVKFYNYELQDKEKHKKGDHVIAGLEKELAQQCKLCIENTAKEIAYDCVPILVLSKDARKSDGGIFV